MKIALLQMDIVWGCPQENIRKAEALMDGLAADLYVLPEMWATGYSAHPEKIAEEEKESVALAWMKDMARRRQCALCGSLTVRDAQGYYRNRLYFVTPDALHFYDKRHLFTHAHEDQNYRRGDRPVVVTYRGMRLLLQVCYDLRIPVWTRWGRPIGPAAADGQRSEERTLVYDAIVYVANWPDARQNAWETLLRARAIENQCYVVAVNRVGDERKSHFAGGSVLIDPNGKTISACDAGESICQGEMVIEVIEASRQAFPVLLDRDEV